MVAAHSQEHNPNFRVVISSVAKVVRVEAIDLPFDQNQKKIPLFTTFETVFALEWPRK